jgi:hypothetical protein
MQQIPQTALAGNVPRIVLAARLADIRAEIRAVLAAPYRHGFEGPHRRRRDEFILHVFAADVHARLVEARAT